MGKCDKISRNSDFDDDWAKPLKMTKTPLFSSLCLAATKARVAEITDLLDILKVDRQRGGSKQPVSAGHHLDIPVEDLIG